MYRLWFFLTVCIYGIVAFRIEDEFKDLNDWMYDDDAASENKDGDDECKRDLLIILDLSSSIPKNSLQGIKNFVKGIIESPKLRVGPDGTRVGLIRFDKKTELLFDIGTKTKTQMLEETDGLEFNKETYKGTFTDLALEEANTIFPEKSPKNKRPVIADAVMLITDGEPHGKRNVKEDTMKQAQKLKDKNVNITVAAISRYEGSEKQKKLVSYMEKLATSPKHVFNATYDNVETLLGALVKTTCAAPVNPGTCSCFKSDPLIRTIEPGKSTTVSPEDLTVRPPHCDNGAKLTSNNPEVNPKLPHTFSAGTHNVYFTFALEKAKVETITCPARVRVKEFKGTCSCDENTPPIKRTINSEESTVEVDLPSPQPSCVHGATVINEKTEPQLPHKFSAGLHAIKYTFFLSKAKVRSITCPVNVEVKVMCDGVAYFPGEKSCCCGTTYKKMTGYKCCGKHYYNQNMKCCGGVNLVSLSESC